MARCSNSRYAPCATESIPIRYRNCIARGIWGAPLYYDLALGVGKTAELMEFPTKILAAKRQPNFFVAVINLLGGPLSNVSDFKCWLDTNGGNTRQEMLHRSTQANESARCACIVPVLAKLEGPLAIIETGTSARLNLYLDRFGYSYNGEASLSAAVHNGRAYLRVCVQRRDTHIASAAHIGWRMGLDLDPLDMPYRPSRAIDRMPLMNLVGGTLIDQIRRLKSGHQVAPWLNVEIVSGNCTQSNFVRHQTALTGAGNAGSAKHPTATPTFPGYRSSCQYNVVPQRGQNLILTLFPASEVRS